MDEKRNYIISVALETKNIQRGLQEVKNAEKELERAQRNIQRTILAPTGNLSAQQYLSQSSPFRADRYSNPNISLAIPSGVGYSGSRTAFQQYSMMNTIAQARNYRRMLPNYGGSRGAVGFPSSGVPMAPDFRGFTTDMPRSDFIDVEATVSTGPELLGLTYQRTRAQRIRDIYSAYKNKYFGKRPSGPIWGGVGAGFSGGQEPPTGIRKFFDSGGEDSPLSFNFSKKTKTPKPEKDFIWEAAKRAATIVPIWMAVRVAYQAVFDTINGGVRHVLELDSALQKIKNVLIGVKDESKFVKELGFDIENLSGKTGKGVGEISEAFYAFGDAGLDAKVAMAGMKVATEGALAMFADTKETAMTLSDIYLLYGDSIKGATTEQEKMQYIMSSIATLQKTNKFTLTEFTEALRTFAPAAKASGISLDDMLFTLAKTHTYMQRGSRGGTELARAFYNLSIHADRARKVLPDVIDISSMNKYELFDKVMSEFNRKLESGVDIGAEMNQVFGLGTKVAAPLIVQWKKLNEERDKYNKLTIGDKNKEFNKQLENATSQIKVQWEITKQLNEQITSYYLKAYTGFDNLAKVLEKINSQLRIMVGLLQDSDKITSLAKKQNISPGEVIWKSSREELEAGLSGELNNKQLIKLRNRVSKVDEPFFKQSFGYEPSNRENLLKLIDALLQKRGDQKKTEDEVVKLLDIQVKKSKDLVRNYGDISKTFDYQETLLNKRKALGYSDIEIEKQKLALLVKYNETEDKINTQRVKIIQMMIEETNRLAGVMHDAMSEGFEGLLKGETTVKGTFAKLGDTFNSTAITQMSKGLTDRVFKNTKIGESFGGVMSSLRNVFSGESPITSNIKSSFEYGADLTYNRIVQGFTDAQILNKGTGISNYISSGMNLTGAGATSTGVQQIRDKNGNIISVPTGTPQKDSSSGNGGGFAQGMSIGIQSALMAYSSYQSGVAGGLTSGQAGARAGLQTTGSLLMMTGQPHLMVAGALMTLGSMFIRAKKSEETQTETKVTENRISSKIDITNRSLEVINRNMVGLRQDIRTYIMLPQSAYFSEKDTIEEEFALSARRGTY